MVHGTLKMMKVKSELTTGCLQESSKKNNRKQQHQMQQATVKTRPGQREEEEADAGEGRRGGRGVVEGEEEKETAALNPPVQVAQGLWAGEEARLQGTGLVQLNKTGQHDNTTTSSSGGSDSPGPDGVRVGGQDQLGSSTWCFQHLSSVLDD